MNRMHIVSLFGMFTCLGIGLPPRPDDKPFWAAREYGKPRNFKGSKDSKRHSPTHRCTSFGTYVPKRAKVSR